MLLLNIKQNFKGVYKIEEVYNVTDIDDHGDDEDVDNDESYFSELESVIGDEGMQNSENEEDGDIDI